MMEGPIRVKVDGKRMGTATRVSVEYDDPTYLDFDVVGYAARRAIAQARTIHAVDYEMIADNGVRFLNRVERPVELTVIEKGHGVDPVLAIDTKGKK